MADLWVRHCAPSRRAAVVQAPSSVSPLVDDEGSLLRRVSAVGCVRQGLSRPAEGATFRSQQPDRGGGLATLLRPVLHLCVTDRQPGIVYQTFVPAPCDYGPRDHPGFTVAVRASDGKDLWYYRGPPSESATLLHRGTLYFGSWDHHLYALDVRRRKPRLRWRFEADDELNSSPAYDAGTIYIGSDGGYVYAVDARTGKQRWRAAAFAHFGRREYFYATPSIAYGRVYIGNTDGTVYAFGAKTGDLLWTQHAGTYVYTAAAVWRRTVYVGSYDGNVYALDAATGDIRWKRDLGASIHGAPTVIAGLIYFSTCGTCGHRGSRYAKMGPRKTFALDARTGRIVWRFGDGRYSPIVSDGIRVYLMGDTRLYGLAPIKKARPRVPPA